MNDNLFPMRFSPGQHPITDHVKKVGVLLTMTLAEIGKHYNDDKINLAMAKEITDEIFLDEDIDEVKLLLSVDINDVNQVSMYCSNALKVIKLRAKTEEIKDMMEVVVELWQRTKDLSFSDLEDFFGYLYYLIKKDDNYKDSSKPLIALYAHCRDANKNFLPSLLWGIDNN